MQLDRKLDRGNQKDGKEKKRDEQPTRAPGVKRVLESELRFLFPRNLLVRFGRRIAVARQGILRLARLLASDNWIWNLFSHVCF